MEEEEEEEDKERESAFAVEIFDPIQGPSC